MLKQKLEISTKLTLLITFVISGLIWFPSFASYETSTAVGTEEKKKENKYINSLSYGLSSDALDNSEQSLLSQGVRYNGTYFFLENKYYASAGLGASFQSVDNQLVEDDNGSFHLTDFFMRLGNSGFKIYGDPQQRVQLFTSVSSVLPLSENSRNEGYKAVPSGRADLSYSRGRFDFVLTGQYTYVFNSFDNNTNGDPNLESSVMGGVGVRLNYQNFRAQYSYRLGLLNYLDGSTLGSSGNSLSLTGIINKNFWASIATSNVNYVENQFIDAWFYDPFVRIYSLSIGVTF